MVPGHVGPNFGGKPAIGAYECLSARAVGVFTEHNVGYWAGYLRDVWHGSKVIQEDSGYPAYLGRVFMVDYLLFQSTYIHILTTWSGDRVPRSCDGKRLARHTTVRATSLPLQLSDGAAVSISRCHLEPLAQLPQLELAMSTAATMQHPGQSQSMPVHQRVHRVPSVRCRVRFDADHSCGSTDGSMHAPGPSRPLGAIHRLYTE